MFAAGDQHPRLENVVEIQVHEKGGLFGTERTVVVDDASITVTEDGTTARQSLTPTARSQLQDAIARVMSDQHPVQAQDVEMYDAAEMTINLQHADRSRTLTIHGADEPSESVLDLLELIDAASETGV